MKVLHLSTTDKIGGAGIAAYRLHTALQRISIESHMLVLRKVSSDPAVHRISSYFNRWQRLKRRYATYQHEGQLTQYTRVSNSSYWSLNNSPYPIADVVNTFDADIVQLHWIGDNYLPIQELAKINKPIVWTLHDMWTITGGCHYSGDCHKYQTGCGQCPQLVNSQGEDITTAIIQRKFRDWTSTPSTIITPSNWLADCVKSSYIFADKSLRVIPNPIDTTNFKPIETMSARHAFNLPSDKNLILFGAFGGTHDPRKGFLYLRDALQQLPESNNIELVVFGSQHPLDLSVNLPVHQIGRLQDEVSLSLLYSACDVFVAPSLQDNLPNTILEALACGTPCIAFNTGGIPDLITHKQNGYLAKPYVIDDLTNGILWTMNQTWQPGQIHQKIADHYASHHIAEQYKKLYQSIIN